MLVDRIVEKLNKCARRVLVIGDVMIDRWIIGRTEKCQDDCVKFAEENYIELPGGAGNAGRCLGRWPNLLVEVVGQQKQQRPTKTRFIENGKILFRYDSEQSITSPWESHKGYPKYIFSELDDYCAVLLSDYAKGMLSEGFIKGVAERCKTLGIPCVADCKRGPKVYEGCILKGNKEWASRHDLSAASKIVITQGEGPPYGRDEGWSWSLNPKSEVSLANHVGAGDCFAAHLVLGLACGLTLEESAAVAHSAGRVYVQHFPNYPPSPEEIAADLSC